MDYFRNADKFSDTCVQGVSYGQVADVDNGTATASDVLTLDNAKAYMKLDSYTDDDALITVLITTAIAMCERWCNTNFTKREVVAVLNNINGGSYLPYGPVSGTVTGVDIDGNSVDVTIMGVKWKQLRTPISEYVALTYNGGFDTCPSEYINAVKQQVLYLYENRGDANAGMSPQAIQTLQPVTRV